MFKKIVPFLFRNLQKLTKQKQLMWMIGTAGAFIIAFVISMQIFISIAQDAQQRIIDTRISSIQNIILQGITLDDVSKEKIDTLITKLVLQNQAIVDLTFYKKDKDEFIAYASSDTSKINISLKQNSEAVQRALRDPKNSYTSRSSNDLGKYTTFKSFYQNDELIGIFETTQTVSSSDQIIEENIQKGIMISTILLLILLFLFFKYSRIIDYIKINETLKKVDRLKDNFISLASHELKTPLTVIRGYSEYITEGETVPEEYKEYSKKIDSASKQLVLFVEDIIEVLQIEQGQTQFEEQKILIPQYVKKIITDFENTAHQKNIKISLIQEGLTYSYIIADEIKLKKALTQIINNAITYTNKGEIKIILSNIKDTIEIKISDTGIGMSEEEKSHVFEKFYRAKNEDTEHIKGTGLGLWIAKELIERMNGTLSVESIQNKGTDVIINFDALQ